MEYRVGFPKKCDFTGQANDKWPMMFNPEEIYYRMIKILFKLLGFISLKQARSISMFLGNLLFLVDKKHQKIVVKNLTRTFGMEKNDREIRKLGRKVFGNMILIIFEIAWSLSLSKEQLVKHFKIKGYSNIKSAFEKGKGVLVLTAHFGNWELLTVTATMIRYPLNIVVRPLDFMPFDRFIYNLRTRFGGKIIPKQKSFRSILKSLDRGEMVALLMDQNVDWYEGVFVDFFGSRACTNKGLALLALKTGAPVASVFMVREKEGFKAVFGPEIPFINTGDKTRDIEDNTRRYNRVIEEFIRQYPEQWFWFHQRWKTRPYCSLHKESKKKERGLHGFCGFPRIKKW